MCLCQVSPRFCGCVCGSALQLSGIVMCVTCLCAWYRAVLFPLIVSTKSLILYSVFLSEIFSRVYAFGGFWPVYVGKTLAAKRGCHCGSEHWGMSYFGENISGIQTALLWSNVVWWTLSLFGGHERQKLWL